MRRPLWGRQSVVSCQMERDALSQSCMWYRRLGFWKTIVASSFLKEQGVSLTYKEYATRMGFLGLGDEAFLDCGFQKMQTKACLAGTKS